MKRLVTCALATAVLTIMASGSLAEEVVVHPVLEVREWNQDWEELTVVIRNPGAEPEVGFLVIWYIYQGQAGGWGLEIELDSDTEMALSFNLSGQTTIGVGVYKNKPTSITDAPEPVARKVKRRDTPPPDDDD